LVWADGGYAGKLVDWARTGLKIALQIVKTIRYRHRVCSTVPPLGRGTHLGLDRRPPTMRA
jgi:hypothetical protein